MSLVHRDKVFYYRPLGKTSGHVVGAWKGFRLGGGGFNAARASLIDYPDPRRISIHESIMNLTGGLIVKKPTPMAKINVSVVLDLSDSMIKSDGISHALDFACTAANSVRKTGDYFGLVCFSSKIHEKSSYRPNKNNYVVNIADILDEASHLEKLQKNFNHKGLQFINTMLNTKKSLVFLISDFLYSEDELVTALKKLANHYVIPVVLQKEDKPKKYRFNKYHDLETGNDILFFGTQSQIRFYDESRILYKDKLDHIFKKYANPAIYMEFFSENEVTKYFSKNGMLG